MSQQYGDEYSEVVDEDDDGIQPARPSIKARLLSLFGFGLTASPGSPDGDRDMSNIDARIKAALAMPVDRRKQYAVYAQMMNHPVTSGIIEALAEEATQEDQETKQLVWPVAHKFPEVGREVKTCFSNIKEQHNSYPITESFCAFGDHFERLLCRPNTGVIGMNRLLQSEVDRVEDTHRRIVGFRVQGATFARKSDKSLSYPWDVVHWRLPPRYDPTRITSSDLYGRAWMYAATRPWRALVLSEDRLLKQRLKRTGGRYLVKVPVGATATEKEKSDQAREVRKRLEQAEAVDPSLGIYSKRADPVSDMENVYWPVAPGEENPEIVPFPEVSLDNSLFDIDYFNDQIYGVSKFPKEYFGKSGNLAFDRTKTISQQDIRVSRIARRVRSIYVAGLKTIADIHLSIVYSRENSPMSPEDAIDAYALHVPRLGSLEELDRMEVVKMQIDVAEALAGLGQGLHLNPSLWTAYLLVNYLKLDPEDVMMLLAKGELTSVGVPGDEDAETNAQGIGRESQLYRGLNSLNEREKSVLNRLSTETKVSRGLIRIAEMTGCHYTVQEDDSLRLPQYLMVISEGNKGEKLIDEYLQHDQEQVKLAVLENYRAMRPKQAA